MASIVTSFICSTPRPVQQRGRRATQMSVRGPSQGFSRPLELCFLSHLYDGKTYGSVMRQRTPSRHVATHGLSDSASVPVLTTDKQQISPEITLEPGVYAVYDISNTLQYVGISRKVAVSIQTHVESLGPEMVASVKFDVMPGAGKEELTDAWKKWIEGAVEETGNIPPGNVPGETMWTQRKRRMAKPEIKLTPGKGIEDLTCSIDDLIDQVVKTNRVVAFVKGTRFEPACGFSYKVLTMLTEVSGQDFEVVNVLDEVYNPGLREAIKQYSQWPTIPQVYVDGEFIGGADIIEELHASGDLASMLKS